MILSVGIDIVEVARIAKAMKRPQFLQRILTPTERKICQTSSRVAGRWAAKEAIYKCFSPLGIRLTWHQIEILNKSSGEPSVQLKDVDITPFVIHLSISHEKTLASAVVILERK